MFEDWKIEDVLRIALAGGGMDMHASNRTTAELIRIALAASTRGTRLIFRGLADRQTDDLVRIALAGKGTVLFAD